MAKDGPSEEWLDFIVDSLKPLDEDTQGAFLQEFLLRLVGLQISEKDSITHWEGVLARQSQLAEKLGRPVTLRTAAVDYFGELRILRSPILMEYDELRKLQHTAATDSLTGLNNRRIFDEYLHREISRASRYGSLFALLSLDLRKFKSVNDTYGHAIGDEILRGVARAILEVTRGSDISCRTGGDEFAILLPQAERSNAEVLAERIARKFEEYANSIAPNTAVGIDYGVAIFPEDGTDAATLFIAADKVLYASKLKAHNHLATQPHPFEETTSHTHEPLPEVVPAAGSRHLVSQPPSFEEATAPTEEPLPEVVPVAGFRDEPQAVIAAPSVSPMEAEAETVSGPRIPSARKDERIPLEGTRTLGVVRVGGKTNTVRVMDLSRGGVCLLVDQTDLPESFPARLHFPLVPGAELTLRRVYSLPLPEGKWRVGCSFTPMAELFSV